MSPASSPNAQPANANPDSRARTWWREPMMWLVLGGPALVVVASFATLTLAITHPDPVLDTHATSQAADDAGAAPHAGHAPAMQARNHAATGGVPASGK